MRNNLLILSFAAVALLSISGCAGPAAVTPPPTDSSSLEPYVLIGESGRSVKRTVSDIIGRLFMGNFEILGRYSPAGDPDRFVIVVTNRDLLETARESRAEAAFAAAIRIAVTGEGELTYVACQDPEYWANAYFRGDYLSVSGQIARFKQELLGTMPKMRGRFNRPFGGPKDRPLTPEALHTYRYQRQAESLDDLDTLASFGTYEEAVTSIEKRLAGSRELTKVFEMPVPGRKVSLYGLALSGDTGEKQIAALLGNGELRRSASLPYEIMVLENRVVMLPVHFRLPLSFPGMDRKTYRGLQALDDDITRMMRTLVE